MTGRITREQNWVKRTSLWRLLALFALVAWLVSNSCQNKSVEGLRVAVLEVPGREPAKTVLALQNPDRPDQEPRLLVEKFFQVASPEVAFDGHAILFQARRSSEEPWQVWEYDLSQEMLRQVTNSDADCEDPVYLPDGRVLYSRFVEDYNGYRVLETCEIDGTASQQITFGPVDFTSPIVLSDGRVLALSRQVHPAPGNMQLMVMRPDGTKIELFYESGPQRAIVADVKPYETDEGRIVFKETVPGNGMEKEWVSIDYNRPLESRKTYNSKIQERTALIAARPLPKKLPSAVNPETETALLVCMDAGLTESPGHEENEESVQVEILGLQGSLGKVDMEEDGSVYLKIQADMPFRMQTLDRDGKVVQGPSSWLQMRPNERRGCVGCHAGHTRVPDNRQPLAVQKEPVEIPLYREAIMASRMMKSEKE